MKTEAEMLAMVLANVRSPEASEKIPVSAAAGKVSAAEVASPCALPSSNVATMDGFALRHAELPGPLAVAGEATAGTPFDGEVPEKHCVKIATGAWVPPGLDLVTPVEVTETKDSGVVFPSQQQPGDNIRQAGEEIAAGEPVLNAGDLVTARDVALLTGLGVARIDVYRKPVVGILSTGDELRVAGQALEPGACYDANRPMLASLVKRYGIGVVDLGIAKDSLEETKDCLQRGCDECDAVITIGGASVGGRDFVKDVVSDLGQMQSWKVAIKPGKPFGFGSIGDAKIFILPGNPSSAFVTFLLLVLPALLKMSGLREHAGLPAVLAKTTESLSKAPGRTEYIRGILSCEPGGAPSVEAAGPQGSASLPVLAKANCLVRLPLDSEGVAAGETVEVIPLDPLD